MPCSIKTRSIWTSIGIRLLLFSRLSFSLPDDVCESSSDLRLLRGIVHHILGIRLVVLFLRSFVETAEYATKTRAFSLWFSGALTLVFALHL